MYQCGFRKGINPQHCHIAMLEKWNLSKYKGNSFGALLTDLSKAFDCLSYELLIAKLAEYSFIRSALKLMYTYLFDRNQRTKITIFYSSLQHILSSIPQGSILGPLLFSIFLCDLFLIINNIDFASYADKNTPYTTDESAEKVIDKLEIEAKSLFKWFSNNQMKANPNKCHLLISSTSQSELKIGNVTIKSGICEKLLGIKIDNKLRLNAHVEDLCKKASRKVHALARVTSYMTVSKRHILMNAFFRSQFSYCPLVWMCGSVIVLFHFVLFLKPN